MKFTMEEAAQKFGSKPNDVLLYVCPNCSYLHFGHKPTWEMSYGELIDKRRVKEASERRKQLIAQTNDLDRVLARTASKRANQPARQGYPRRIPVSAAAKRKQEDCAAVRALCG